MSSMIDEVTKFKIEQIRTGRLPKGDRLNMRSKKLTNHPRETLWDICLQ